MAPHFYNTEAEIDQAMDTLADIVEAAGVERGR
jgi:selenocysteine lyase/cysteine desulfurase